MLLGFLSCVAALLSTIYIFMKWKFSYWERQGVPTLAPKIPFGNFATLQRTQNQSEITQSIYEQMKGTALFCGMYLLHRPLALILDIGLVKQILITDFQHFIDRGVYYNEKDDPLSAHLFAIEGNRWKNLRKKITPTFTAGKMKHMFPTIIEISERFKNTLIKLLEENQDYTEIKDYISRFGIDVIGTVAFGIECNSLEDLNSQFRWMGIKVFTEPRRHQLLHFLCTAYPNICRRFGYKITRDDVESYFLGILRKTLEYREKNNIVRNDFMDQLLNLKTKRDTDEVSELGLTFEEIAAQAFVFFAAGFETSSTMLTFCMYELSVNPTIQTKLRQHINDVLAKHNGEFTYEAMMDMTYIDQVLNETLRKYPPVGNLLRKCVKDYKVPDMNYTFKKGASIWIPTHAIQNDSNFFPDPNKFDPDRFAPAEIANRDNSVFLAFGDGPRNCIGARFGMMEGRIGLVMLMRNFEFSVCSKTTVPMKFSPKGFVLGMEGGLYVKLKRLTPK